MLSTMLRHFVSLSLTTLILLWLASVSPGLTLAYFASAPTATSIALQTGYWQEPAIELWLQPDSDTQPQLLDEQVQNSRFTHGTTGWYSIGSVTWSSEALELDNQAAEATITQELVFSTHHRRQVAVLYRFSHAFETGVDLPLCVVSWSGEPISVISRATPDWNWLLLELPEHATSGELRVSLASQQDWGIPVTLQIKAVTTDFVLLSSQSALYAQVVPVPRELVGIYTVAGEVRSVPIVPEQPLAFEASPDPMANLLITTTEFEQLQRSIPVLLDTQAPDISAVTVSSVVQHDTLALMLQTPEDVAPISQLAVRYWTDQLEPVFAALDFPGQHFAQHWSVTAQHTAVWQTVAPPAANWFQWRLQDGAGNWSEYSPFIHLERF